MHWWLVVGLQSRNTGLLQQVGNAGGVGAQGEGLSSNSAMPVLLERRCCCVVAVMCSSRCGCLLLVWSDVYIEAWVCRFDPSPAKTPCLVLALSDASAAHVVHAR